MTEPGPFHVPPQGPPQEGPSKEIFARMGQNNVFKMCRDFYEELEKTPLRPMFPADMGEASKKIAAFLTGVLGGPQLYLQQHGPPRMRARHLPFPIDDAARDHWLGAFKKTLVDADKKYNFPPEHLPRFLRFLEEFSAWMVNKV
jgi:hemoglobin